MKDRPAEKLAYLSYEEEEYLIDVRLGDQEISPHQMSLADLLAAARLQGLYPKEVVLLAMQPGSIDPGLELSPPVEAQVDHLIDEVVRELKGWGYEPCRSFNNQM